MKEKKLFSVHNVALIGVLAAMVFALTKFVSIPIPSPLGKTALSVGNAMCVLAALLFGPGVGGLAAGIGSMFFDLTNPVYIASAPFTFAFKFLMAWICGMIASAGKKEAPWKAAIGAITGAISYVLLYLAKSFVEDRFVLGLPLDAVWLTVTQKGLVSTVNGIIAAVVSVPLYLTLRPLLRRAKLL